MHEVSLVRSLIRQVERIASDEKCGAVTEVRVSIGPLSGVEPLLVQGAFDQLAPDSSLTGCRLRIDHAALEARCRQCGEDFAVESFVFKCPVCGSGLVRVTAGDEFRLVSISVEETCSEGMTR